MSNISVNLKTSNGINTSRIFNSNVGVSVYGKATTLLKLGFNPLTKITMNVLNSSKQSIFYDETLTDFYGDYDFYFTTPSQGKYDIKLTAYYIDGAQSVIVPIGVNTTPSPVPTGGSANIFDLLKYGIIIAGGVLIYKVVKM